jgi:hypothetical protein
MKCLVCGKVYEGSECPRCQFPDVQLPGDREKALANLKPSIDAYRTTFLQSIKVALVIYRWKDQDGTVILDHEDHIPLGSGYELTQSEQWLSEKFARIPEAKQLSVTIRVTSAEGTQTKTIQVPNLQRAELQQLGAQMDDNCNIRLLLRNDTDSPVKSEFVPLFS